MTMNYKWTSYKLCVQKMEIWHSIWPVFPYPSNSAATEGSKYLVLTEELITRFLEK
jgi:hypothetical protein